jgi:hypothetical protein
VEVGDSSYVARRSYGEDSYTVAGFGGGGSWNFASDIGPSAYSNFSISSGWYRSGLDFVLVYAQVAGATFGAPPEPFPYVAPERFYPLAVGDDWVYRRRIGGAEQGYLVRRVVGDTTLGGVAFALVREEVVGAAGGVQTCAVRFDGRWMLWEPIDGPCEPLEERMLGRGSWVPLSHVPRYTYTCAADVGVTSYPADACFEFRVSNVYENEGTRFATDIGLTSVWALGVGWPEREQYTLQYARVGGVTYGESPVAAEPGPGGAVLGLRVAPNPARGTAALTVALPAPADVRADVFDALGRRVLALTPGRLPAGQHQLLLNASALAPGAYLVRLSAGEAAATRLLVVAR